MPTILITGGTGLVGTALSKALLEKGYRVVILSRSTLKPVDPGTSLQYATWNIKKDQIDEEAVSGADHIIHLAGAGIADKRWTKKRKQEIVASRVDSSRLIVDSLKTIPNKVKTVVSASAIGWYGPGNGSGHPFTEPDPPGNDFLADTCRQWEESIEPVTQLGKRLVKLRTGIVISRKGGVMKELMRPLRFGFATILGSGKQVTSWIHINDLVMMYINAIENDKMNGVYNAVAPAAVSNKELVLQLARSRQKFFIPVHIPSFVLKMLLGEMSVEVLKSATISPAKITKTGFIFNYPAIGNALK